MKLLHPSFANPSTWRTNSHDFTPRDAWRRIRLKILERDNFACQYCDFKAEKWQIVHHIDGNPNNNRETNLMTVCQMCNLVEHAGMGCVIQGIVDLYEKSHYNQNEVIIKTREWRSRGKSDQEIINELGLRHQVEFKQDWDYLRRLIGFVTSRKPSDEKTIIALEYEYEIQRKQPAVLEEKTKTLFDYTDVAK